MGWFSLCGEEVCLVGSVEVLGVLSYGSRNDGRLMLVCKEMGWRNECRHHSQCGGGGGGAGNEVRIRREERTEIGYARRLRGGRAPNTCVSLTSEVVKCKAWVQGKRCVRETEKSSPRYGALHMCSICRLALVI